MAVGNTNVTRERIDASHRATAAAQKINKILHLVEVNADLANKVPSVVSALRGLKHAAEQAALERTLAVQDRSGTAQHAWNTANTAQCAAQKA